jgi:hypothetical protein
MKGGHSSSCSVREALLNTRDLLSWSSYAVIRSLDSARSENDVQLALNHHGVPHEVSFGNVVLTMSNVWRAVDAGVLTGFDEIWIYAEKPPQEPLTDTPPATSDGVTFMDGIPADLVSAAERTKCVLVLGDGCGLNFVTWDDNIAKSLQATI